MYGIKNGKIIYRDDKTNHDTVIADIRNGAFATDLVREANAYALVTELVDRLDEIVMMESVRSKGDENERAG